MGEKPDSKDAAKIAKQLSLPDEIVSMLEQPLSGHRDRTVVHRLAGLAGKGNAHALDALAILARGSRPDAVAAYWALATAAKNNGPHLITDALDRNSDPDCRCTLLVVLANTCMGSASAQHACTFLAKELAEEKNATVRWHIAWALERLAQPGSEGYFIEMLADAQKGISEMAARALEGVGTEKSVPALKGYLERMQRTCTDAPTYSQHPVNIARRALEAIELRCRNPLSAKGGFMEPPARFCGKPQPAKDNTMKNPR